MSENLNKKRHTGLDVMTVGFALFAMFFGAGNLIFPPELGVKAGPDWWIGVVCFILADAGIALIALFSLIKYDGDIEKITGTVGQKMGVVINAIMILCIGVLVATPRTAATTFEMGFTPITGIDSKIAGEVDLLIFPNIEAGNIMGKSWLQFNGAKWAGIVLGAAAPVILGSRSDTPEIKINSIALACLAAAK